MRELQKSAKTEIESVVDALGVTVSWQEFVAGPLPAMSYAPDDVDLQARFELCGRKYEIWLYPDDFSLSAPGTSRVIESQDYPGDPEGQIRALCDVLRAALPTSLVEPTPEDGVAKRWR